jgi:hypothetical protein
MLNELSTTEFGLMANGSCDRWTTEVDEHAGVFDFVVLANDQEVDRQQFEVVAIEEAQDEEEDPGEPDES